MRKLHLIWVTTCMHIEIYRYPAWSDVVEIETWWQAEGKIGTRCDFILKDYANGEVIGRASSDQHIMGIQNARSAKIHLSVHRALDGRYVAVWIPPEDAARSQHKFRSRNWCANCSSYSNTNFNLGIGVLIAVSIPKEHSASGSFVESAMQKAWWTQS
uniref:Acyl-[acyl-carrier-protein] hydrolase n=1 Tax=Chenopodium quinoa TaxID=63459 RepID=A0A803MSP3_CHEQI